MITSLSIKKIIPAASAILLFLFSQIAWSGSFTESPHDFRKYPWNRSGENCLPCHVMQGTKSLAAPLWNPASSTQTYTMWGETFQPAKGSLKNSLPDGISKNCLSCHDGIIASDTYGLNTGSLAFDSDKDLTGIIQNNNHPISFVYDAALATKYGDLYDPSTRPSGVANGSGTITSNDPPIELAETAASDGTINADMLFLNRVECSSCHDVHNTKAVPGTKLLVKDSAGSALCLTCHNK